MFTNISTKKFSNISTIFQKIQKNFKNVKTIFQKSDAEDFR